MSADTIQKSSFLVGGAVRDERLGRPVSDRDFVVVGQTPEAMIAAGFTQVGRDFPVFLHPQTKEEFALARTERKTGAGHTGFTVHADPSITLEQDLERRDLTINAMAQAANGKLVDPFGGLQDIRSRTLRHVSPAFAEDPLRVLRVARLAAQLADWDFRVAPETLTLMRDIATSGEMAALPAERIWQETGKALATPRPSIFFSVLRECDALKAVFPEVDALFGVRQPPEHHPEIDTGVHTLLVLDQAAAMTDDLDVRFAALVHDLGKGVTPVELLPKHHGHEQSGVPLVESLAKRLKVSKEARGLAVVVAEFHTHCHRALELRPGKLLKVFEALDAFRKPHRVEQFTMACEADARGRTGFEDRDFPQAGFLRGAFLAAAEVSVKPLLEKGLTGSALGEALREERLRALDRFRA